LGESKVMTVRGQEATGIVDEAGGNTILFWTEDGTAMALAGRISLEEATKVAESLQYRPETDFDCTKQPCRPRREPDSHLPGGRDQG